MPWIDDLRAYTRNEIGACAMRSEMWSYWAQLTEWNTAHELNSNHCNLVNPLNHYKWRGSRTTQLFQMLPSRWLDVFSPFTEIFFMISCGAMSTPTPPVAHHLCALMLPALPIQHMIRGYVYPSQSLLWTISVRRRFTSTTAMAPSDHHPSWQNQTSSICTGILQGSETPMNLNANRPFATRLVGWLLDPSTVLLE